MTNTLFSDLQLSDELQQAINDMGFIAPSPIQAEAIPLLLNGSDIIGQAQTGTGKTAAFGIPLLEDISGKEKDVSALIMCPTRELAIQVAQELKKLAKYKKAVHILPVYGGEPIQKQINALKRRVQVVVGTPGRILDHLNRKTISLTHVKMVVLDEADEMLNMGFRDDMEKILSNVPEEKQIALFSATMPKPILEISQKYLSSPELVKVNRNEVTLDAIEQKYFDLKGPQKTAVIASTLIEKDLQLVLIFCNTKRRTEEVAKELQAIGLNAEAIHGDLRQNQRNNVLGRFRKGAINLLIATDVAARGIDVSNVDAVFNYDLPHDPEVYVHRIGRTGRAGNTGIAYSFITGKNERLKVREIENYTGVKLQQATAPNRADLAQINKTKLLERLKEMSRENLSVYDQMLEEFIQDGLTLDKAAAALLKIALNERQQAPDSPQRDRNEKGRDKKKDFQRNGKMVRLFMNAGKKDKISAGDVAGAFISIAGLQAEEVGVIELREHFSFVEVSEKKIKKVMKSIPGNKIKGRKINLDVAHD